jgi:hypothetical protein
MALLWTPILAGPVSKGPQEVGEVVPREVLLKEGKVLLRVDSGGCTDEASIRASVQKRPGMTAKAPHYVVTFERVRVDDCKAMLFEGVVLEYDLAKDLGISGLYTLSVTNWSFPRSASSSVGELPIRKALLAATVKAIEMEIRGYEAKLKIAESGTGPASNAALFKDRIAESKGRLATFQKLDPADYPAPETEAASVDLFDEAGYGPVIPAKRETVKVAWKASLREGSLLDVEGTSKSGPFYHLAGFLDGIENRLEPGSTREATLHLVYKREYVGFFSDYYVCITAIK